MLTALPPHFNILLQIIESSPETVGEPLASENRPGSGLGHGIGDIPQQTRFDRMTVGFPLCGKVLSPAVQNSIPVVKEVRNERMKSPRLSSCVRKFDAQRRELSSSSVAREHLRTQEQARGAAEKGGQSVGDKLSIVTG